MVPLNSLDESTSSRRLVNEFQVDESSPRIVLASSFTTSVGDAKAMSVLRMHRWACSQELTQFFQLSEIVSHTAQLVFAENQHLCGRHTIARG